MGNINDLSKEDREQIRNEIEKGNAALGRNDEWDNAPARYSETDELGLCGKCSNLNFYRKRYGSALGKCYEWNTIINPKDPVEECTYFNPKGHLSLTTMINIATLIDPTADTKIGF